MYGFSADDRMRLRDLRAAAKLVELVDAEAMVRRERLVKAGGFSSAAYTVTDEIRFAGFADRDGAQAYGNTPVEDLMVFGHDENGERVEYPVVDMARWVYEEEFRVQYL